MVNRYARVQNRLTYEHLENRYLLANTYFVDTASGTDLQSTGSFEQPFKSISRAALFADPGDTVSIRGGVYREEVSLPRSGAAGSPITFEAYDDEDVLVTTTDLITGWTQHDGNIYRATLDSNLVEARNVTLFVEGVLMEPAHWSDQGGNLDRLNIDTWATMSNGDRNTITDTALANMQDDLWNGGFVYARTTFGKVEARRILDFDSNGTFGTITLEDPFDSDPRAGYSYLIFDDYDALDAPGEWYFEEETNSLFFWAPGGVDPDTLAVEVKRDRREAFDLDGHDHIHIRGIDMRGGDLDMIGSDHILLEGAYIQMPDYGFAPEGSGGPRALIIDGNYNVIRDTEFDGVHGTAIRLSGSHNVFVNNHYHEIGFNNVNGAAFSIREDAVGNLISHSTFERVGRAAIGGIGGERNVIQYNEFFETSQMTGDVGAIYFVSTELGQMQIHHNVLHSITREKAGGIYFDNNTTDAAVYNNISYNTPNWGGKTNLPNAFVLWFNNTHYSSGLISSFVPNGARDAATGSKFFNNIITEIEPELLGGADSAEQSNNVFSGSSANFVNVGAADFRLQPTSAAIDAGIEITGITDEFSGLAPDAGALEFGEEMWAYGHNFSQPHRATYHWSPVPFSNRVENSGFDIDLASWATVSGSPTRYVGNSFGYRDDALATYGTGSVELKPGDEIEQIVTGLVPNTTYEISGNARLTKELQLEEFDSASGSFTFDNFRAEDYIGDIDAGEWLRFDNVDFGTGSPRFDRVEIGTQTNPALDVEIRLGSPTGTLIGTINVPSRGEPWFITVQDIAATTGTHDLYVVFQGDGGTNGRFDRIRLLNTNESERVTFGVKDFDSIGSTPSISIGGAYWADAAERLTFTTGPNSDSATIFIAKQGGDLNGYVDGIGLVGDQYQSESEDLLEVTVDPETGHAVLANNTAGPITFNGYTISDSLPSLLPSSWFSLDAQQVEAGAWDEAGASLNSISESNPASATTLDSGELIYLGQILDAPESLKPSLHYNDFDQSALVEGIFRFDSLDLPELPGDYDMNGAVSGSDFLAWQRGFGSSIASFTGTDGNGSGEVDQPDYELWARHYGQSVESVVVVKTLIDDTINNGSFENIAGGQGAPEQTNANRVAASFDTPNTTDTQIATIPGWTVNLERYLDGNSGNTFAGFDSGTNRAADGMRFAFANKRSRATLTSSFLSQHTTSAGDIFTLQFDTGSVESTNADYIVRLKFGSQVHELGSFTETSNGVNGVAAYTEDRTFEYTAIAADAGEFPVVEFVINAGPNTSNGQWLVDNVRLSVETEVPLQNAESASAAGPAVAPLQNTNIVELSPTSQEADAATVDVVFTLNVDEPSINEPTEDEQLLAIYEAFDTLALRVLTVQWSNEPPPTSADTDLGEAAEVSTDMPSSCTPWLSEEMLEQVFS